MKMFIIALFMVAGLLPVKAQDTPPAWIHFLCLLDCGAAQSACFDDCAESIGIENDDEWTICDSRCRDNHDTCVNRCFGPPAEKANLNGFAFKLRTPFYTHYERPSGDVVLFLHGREIALHMPTQGKPVFWQIPDIHDRELVVFQE